MMRRDVITMQIVEPELARDFDKRVLKRSRWRLVTAIRQWLFNKIAEPSVYKRWHTVSINTDDIIEMIRHAAISMRQIASSKGGKVYMGPEQFYRAANQATKNCGVLGFSFRSPMGIDGNTQILGFDVKVIPWMDGVLVVPND
jgi:hypothetical protein